MSIQKVKQEILKASLEYKDEYKAFKREKDFVIYDHLSKIAQYLSDVSGGGVSQIVAGSNINISPAGGTGVVTINASGGSSAPTGYGSFYSSVTQTLASANTPQAVTLGSTYEANGTSTSGSRIYLNNAGTYQFSYVAQVASNSNGQETAEFWIKYNGVVYPNSNTKLVLQPRKADGQPSEQLMTFIINGTSLNNNDYIELFWEATSTQVSLKYEPANAVYPATPSVIANVIPIGAQSGGSLYTQTIIAYRTTSQASGSTMNLTTNGTGVGGLIGPTTSNSTWNVTIDTIATVIGITGTATGVSVGDTYSETTRLVFKKVSGVSTLIAIISSEAGFDTSMTTSLMNYSVGGSQNLNLQFQFPTFAGGGLVQINAISKLEIVEVTY